MTCDGKKRMCVAGIIGGALCAVASPMIGLAGTVWGMTRSFHELGDQGIGNPARLSSSIGSVLTSTVAGLVMIIPGLIVMIVSIVQLVSLRRSNAPPSPNAPP